MPATPKEEKPKAKYPNGSDHPLPERPEYQLAPALWLCTRCNRRVLKRTWNMETGWKDLPTLQNALDGSEHDCKSTQKEQKKGANTWLRASKD